MNTDTIEMTYYPNNVSVTINAEDPQQSNSSYYNRAIAIVNNSSFAGFVIGGAIGALIGVPIASIKGFNTEYLDLSSSASIAIVVTTYVTGCILGAYYKPIFSGCKQIATKSYSTCTEKTRQNILL